MTAFTTEEMNDIVAILNIESEPGGPNQTKVIYDVEQGVFTSGTLGDANARILTLSGHATLKADMAQLSNDLMAGNQLVAPPPAFTSDELAQMAIIENATTHPNVVALADAAAYVGFWSSGQESALVAKEGSVGPNARAAIIQLDSDLHAGNQILPDAHIVGIHNHFHFV